MSSNLNPVLSNNSRNSLTIFSLVDAGNFGHIYLVRKNGGTDDGLIYAMKTIEPDPHFDYGEQHRNCRNELKILKLVHGAPFFVQLKYACKTRFSYHFVMDYMWNGNLFNYIERGCLTLKEAKVCCAEIVIAIQYLHEKRIVYRDLKLENILIAGNGHILLTDFGLTVKIRENERLYDVAGTEAYFAPEMLNGQGHSFEVDWWSLGIITYEFLIGHTPFVSSLSKKISDHVIRNRIQKAQPCLEKLNSVGQHANIITDLIKQLLIKDPQKRLGSGQNGYIAIKRHPFFVQLNWTAVKLMRYPCLERQIPSKQIEINYTKQMGLSLEEPKENRRKEFHYVAPELREDDDQDDNDDLFYGFTEEDLARIGEPIRIEPTICAMELKPDLFVMTRNPAELIKQMILPKKTVKFTKTSHKNTDENRHENRQRNVTPYSIDTSPRRSGRVAGKRRIRFHSTI